MIELLSRPWPWWVAGPLVGLRWRAPHLAAPMKPKENTPGLVRYWAGGTLFGVGWALLGACPGPLYILIGHGETVYAVELLAALAGTWTYGRLAGRLPH